MPSTTLSSPSRRNWFLLLAAAFLLGGCQARSRHCHASSGASDSGDGFSVVLYLVYVLGWLIVATAEG
jgi:hypothetical protein